MKETKLFTVYQKTIKTKDGKQFKLTKASYEGAKGRKFFDLKLSNDNQAKLTAEVVAKGGYPVTLVVDEYWVFVGGKSKSNTLVFKAWRDLQKAIFCPLKEVSVDDLE